MDTDKNLQPSYFSVTPAEVRYCKDIPDGAKLLYGEITALSNKHGYCFASNAYLGELYGNDDRTIRRWVSMLEKKGFVTVLIKGKNRRIYPIVKSKQVAPPITDDHEPVEVKRSEPAKKKKAVKKEKVSYKFTHDDMQLSILLHDLAVKNFPHLSKKKVTLEAWANDMRLLRTYLEEHDKEDEKAGKTVKSPALDRITFMIHWVHGGKVERGGRVIANFPVHTFWAKNILSAAKLRAQWDNNLMPQLQVWMQKTVKKHAVADLSHPGRKPQQVAQL